MKYASATILQTSNPIVSFGNKRIYCIISKQRKVYLTI